MSRRVPASAPMRAAAMFAQLGLARAAASQTALNARSGPQPMLTAPVGDWNERPATRPRTAVAALPAAGPGSDGRQPLYEPGYEGPPRYLGAPRSGNTGAAAAAGNRSAAARWHRPAAAGGHGADARASDGRFVCRQGRIRQGRTRQGRCRGPRRGRCRARTRAPCHRPGMPRGVAAPGAPRARGRGQPPGRCHAAAGPATGPGTGPMPRAATGPHAARRDRSHAARRDRPDAAGGERAAFTAGDRADAAAGNRPPMRPGGRPGRCRAPRRVRMPRAATGPRPRPGAGAPSGEWETPVPPGAAGASRAPDGRPAPGRWPAGRRPPGLGGRRRATRRTGQSVTAATSSGTTTCRRGTAALPEPDPGFRYREPGPGMPGYRGSRDPYRTAVTTSMNPSNRDRTRRSDDHADRGCPDDGRPGPDGAARPCRAHRDLRPAAADVGGQADRDGASRSTCAARAVRPSRSRASSRRSSTRRRRPASRRSSWSTRPRASRVVQGQDAHDQVAVPDPERRGPGRRGASRPRRSSSA